MSYTTHRMRGIAKMRPIAVNDTAWLEVSDAHGNCTDLFMPLTLATAIADVFRAHQHNTAMPLVEAAE